MTQLMATTQEVEPQARRWTREEYYRLADLGLFHGQRVELIDGEIMVFSPQKSLHFYLTDRAAHLLERVFGAGHWVRMQGPIDFGVYSEPEPDVSVVAGDAQDFVGHHPTTALLLVEVSETTLAYDRGRKASLYARVGIADYWIVNLVNLQVEVYRNPAPDATQHYGYRYADRAVFRAGDSVTPLALPQTPVAVADLLP